MVIEEDLPFDMAQFFNLTDDNYEEMAKVAAKILANGGVIAIPTDTSYGIAADARNPQALARLLALNKGRDFVQEPIVVCVSDPAEVFTFGKVTVTPQVLEEFYPGPLTLVFEQSAALLVELNMRKRIPDAPFEIGVRIPDHRFVREVAKQKALAFASILPHTRKVDAFQTLWPGLQGVFDGAEMRESGRFHPKAMTIIDLTIPKFYYFVRQGHCHKEFREKLESYRMLQIPAEDYDYEVRRERILSKVISRISWQKKRSLLFSLDDD